MNQMKGSGQMSNIVVAEKEKPVRTTSRHAASIRGLEKSFVTRKRTVHAVRGIDLDIEEGEYVVVLGPSGCGKTTLIRMIAGLERPTSGRIELQSRAVFDVDEAIDVKPNERNVGMVFQSYALWPHMSVAKNVEYPLRMRKVQRKDRAARTLEALRAVECEPMAKRLPAELSGGQQQRVALARGLVSEPAIFLLDEPLSNLDALLRVSLRAELLRLHRKLGFTAIHITHDQEEALEMADRVILMREGEIVQTGRPEEVYARPSTPYAANFLGIRNKLDVKVVGQQLVHDTTVVAGGAQFAAARTDGEKLQVFARPHKVVVTPVSGPVPSGGLSVEGRLEQVVLDSSDGRMRCIVDFDGVQWFGTPGTGLTQDHVGSAVRVTIDSDAALVYDADGTLINA